MEIAEQRRHKMEQPGPRVRGPTLWVSRFPYLFNKRTKQSVEGHWVARKRDTRALNKRKEASSMLFLVGQCLWRNNLISVANVSNALVIGVRMDHRLGSILSE